MANDTIKNFFIRHRRLLITLSCCFMAIVMISFVAVKANDGAKIEENVQTSAPTKISFIMPIKDGVIIKDYSATALKYNSTLKQWEAHKAVDIKGSDNADVMAVYDGVVVSVESDYLRGNVVVIKHTDSLQTVYASLDDNIYVKAGDRVKKGDVIGKVSTSAKGELNDGMHLHFEVLVDNVKTDPNLYLENSNK